MTEAEWMALTDPLDMLDQIRGPKSKLNYPVVATDRQLPLWASACVRRLGPVVEDAAGRKPYATTKEALLESPGPPGAVGKKRHALQAKSEVLTSPLAQ